MGNMKNCGVFLKKLTAVLLVVGLLVVVISLVTTLIPIGKEIDEVKEHMEYSDSYYGDDEIEELNRAATTAWLSAAGSAVAVFLGCVALYVLGDIADNVWIMARATEKKE